MKRILYCEFCEDGTTGGSHQILFDTVRLLDRRLYAPVVVFYEDNRFTEPLRELGVTVYVWSKERRRERLAFLKKPLWSKAASLVAAIRRRRELLVNESIQLVHLNNSPSMGLDDWLPSAAMLRIPCVSNVMGAPYKIPTKPLHRFLVRRFDRLICISEHVYAQMREGGYPEGQLSLVRVGIDIDRFVNKVKRDPNDLRRSLGIDPPVMLVALVGNLQPWKGHDVVVSALGLLPEDIRQRIHVLFIGAVRDEDRPHVARLRTRMREGNFESAITFLGSREDVPDLLAAADVQLHSSTTPEPFGLVLVEGLALAKPVIAASVGGPREIINSETGRFYDPKDPGALAALLAMLVQNPKLRARLGEAGPRRARRFTAQIWVDNIQKLYASLLGGAVGEANGSAQYK